MIDDQIYNRFARALSEQVRDRAKGLDAASSRIVNTRPQEHVLSGFLTPRSRPAPADHVANADPDDDADELPRDSAFELSAIGLEFMADRKALVQLSSLRVDLSLQLYVRVLPTLAEQRQFGTWQKDRGAAPTTKSQALIPVWKRVVLPRFSADIDVASLLQHRRQRRDVSAHAALPATEVNDTGTFSARHTISITETELPCFESIFPK